MEKYRFLPSTMEHVEELAPALCDEDCDEIWATHHFYPEDALRLSLSGSRMVYTGMVFDTPVFMAGVGNPSFLGDIYKGIPWMLASDQVRDHKLHFLRKSVGFVREMRRGYALLENYVDERNQRAVQWLKWLGFRLDEPVAYGIERRPFHRFWMKGDLTPEDIDGQD